jgi:hypothetical protein
VVEELSEALPCSRQLALGTPVGPTQFETRWRAVLASFDKQHVTLIANNPDATEEINLFRTGLVKVGELIQTSPQKNGNGATWKRLVDKAENEKSVLCKPLDGKALFTGMLRLYAATHREMEDSLLLECAQGKEVTEPHSKRRIRNSDSDDGSSISKWEATEKYRPLPVYRKPRPVVTKNFFAPLTAVSMEAAEVCDETTFLDNNVQNVRPPPIVLTSEVNFLSLQKYLKAVVAREFFFRNTASGTPITTKSMGDYKTIQNLLSQKGLPFFTFYTKGNKPVKAVIRHLPNNTSSEDITVALQELGYEVISVKQITAKRPSPEEEVTLVFLPLFLITLVRNQKSLDIFKVSSFCNIIVEVEAYKFKSGLAQCYNCQRFGHI